LRQYFKIKNIYHSNAIEGNQLDVGETRQVVELGLTITGKPLKDQAEAKNLADALDFLERLVSNPDAPIHEHEIRQIHALVLKGVDDTNAGSYRSVPVEISGSEYRPPEPQRVPPEMEVYAKWLTPATSEVQDFASADGLLNAAVAHTWLVYIHPFVDGNGRVARMLMNLVLMRYGFPIAVITREDRLRYYDALEASQTSDLSPFLSLVTECVEESLEEYEAAAEEQREREEWARSLANRFAGAEIVRVRNEYEVWRSALDLLKSYVRQTVNMIDEEAGPTVRVYFKDFGALEFEKYLSLRSGDSAKKTWFLRVDFVRTDRTARYLFFFGYASAELRDLRVTLHVSREEPAGSYYYERLDQISAPNVPGLVEIGYDAGSEEFAARSKDRRVSKGRIEEIGRRFFEEVIKLHFSA
jgi:Fic family protein